MGDADVLRSTARLELPWYIGQIRLAHPGAGGIARLRHEPIDNPVEDEAVIRRLPAPGRRGTCHRSTIVRAHQHVAGAKRGIETRGARPLAPRLDQIHLRGNAYA